MAKQQQPDAASSNSAHEVARRKFLLTGAATVASVGMAAVLPSAASAASEGFVAGGAKSRTSIDVAKFAPVAANAFQEDVGLADFAGIDGQLTYDSTAQGMYANGASGFVAAGLRVPPGSVFLAASAFGTSSAGQTWSVIAQDIINNTLTTIAQGTTTAGRNFVNLNPSSPYQVGTYNRLVIQAIPSNSSTNVVNGVGYFYVPETPQFRPIAPQRVYDSRLGAGPIAAGQTRLISVANNTSAVQVVPQTARAITYNLTIADTTGQGYLALFPAGTTWSGVSSINWVATGTILANGGTVALGGDRQLNVLCGGTGSTDFIVDVTGYYL